MTVVLENCALLKKQTLLSTCSLLHCESSMLESENALIVTAKFKLLLVVWE